MNNHPDKLAIADIKAEHLKGIKKGMATLKSEDKTFESSFTITAGKILDIAIMSTVTNNKHEQKWQLVDLELHSGQRKLEFKSDPNQSVEAFTAAVENLSEIAHSYVLCREPSPEMDHLIKMVGELIAGSRGKLFFEPSEPSFELTINNVGGGWRVELFVDAGNVETGIYRWDSLGVRFFTTAANLQAFHDELVAEFH